MDVNLDTKVGIDQTSMIIAVLLLVIGGTLLMLIGAFKNRIS